MKTLLATFSLALLLPLPLAAEETPSPDGQLTMVESKPVDTAGEYQLQRLTLRRGDSVLWEYACSTRRLGFKWSADSRHGLLAQWNGARDMSLFVLSIDPDFSPRLQELDLGAVHEQIIAPIPEFYNRPGGSAPVSFVDWNSVRWTEPGKCEMTFIDKNAGLDSTARLQVELGEDRAKLTVLEITDKLAARIKAAEEKDKEKENEKAGAIPEAEPGVEPGPGKKD